MGIYEPADVYLSGTKTSGIDVFFLWSSLEWKKTSEIDRYIVVLVGVKIRCCHRL